MSPSNHGHGLEPEDVDLLFPHTEESQQPPSPPIVENIIDFKKRASGERDDEPETEPPTFDEPWPEPIEEETESKKQTLEPLAKSSQARQMDLFPSDKTWAGEIKKIFRKEKP
jgi:hypothetical protein